MTFANIRAGGTVLAGSNLLQNLMPSRIGQGFRDQVNLVLGKDFFLRHKYRGPEMTGASGHSYQFRALGPIARNLLFDAVAGIAPHASRSTGRRRRSGNTPSRFLERWISPLATAETFILKPGDILIADDTAGGGPTPDKPTVTPSVPDPDHINSFMNFRVADIQACYQLRKSRGTEFHHPTYTHLR